MFLRILFVVFLCFLWITDIRARVLKVSTIATAPFFTGTIDQPEGFLVDLLNDLKEKINADQSTEDDGKITSYEYSLEPRGMYGEIDIGRWHGLIGDLVENRTDLAAAALTITKVRSEVVQFTQPFMSFARVPLVKKPTSGESMPFENLGKLRPRVDAGNLTIGFIRDGAIDDYIHGHKAPFVRSLNVGAQRVFDLEDGIRRVRDEPNFAYYGEHVGMLPIVMNQPCDLQIDWSGMIGEGFYAFALPKTVEGSELTEKFNRAIVEAHEDGTVSSLFLRWWTEKATCEPRKQCMC